MKMCHLQVKKAFLTKGVSHFGNVFYIQTIKNRDLIKFQKRLATGRTILLRPVLVYI